MFEFLLVGQLAEEEEIDGFLEAEAAFGDETVHEVLNGDAAVIKFAGALDAVAVFVEPIGIYLADFGEPRDDARAVYVTQTAFYVVFFVKRRVDGAVFHADVAHLAHPRRVVLHDLFELFHNHAP